MTYGNVTYDVMRDIRENREQINALWDSIDKITPQALSLSYIKLWPDDTVLDLSNALAVSLSSTEPKTIDEIRGGEDGQLVVIRAEDSHVTFASSSQIILSTGTAFRLSIGDFLVLVNVGGDTESGEDGIWFEVARMVILTSAECDHLFTSDGEMFVCAPDPADRGVLQMMMVPK